MGLARGSELMNAVIESLKRSGLDSVVRAAIYKDLIPMWDDCGWDTEQESVGRDWVFDEALQAVREAEAVAYARRRTTLEPVHYWPTGQILAACGTIVGTKPVDPVEVDCEDCIYVMQGDSKGD